MERLEISSRKLEDTQGTFHTKVGLKKDRNCFIIHGFYYVKVCSFYACFLEGFFYHKWMLNFVKAFYASIEIIIWFLSFNLLMWCFPLIESLHSWDKDHLIMM